MSIPIPQILNELAIAGEAGVPVDRDPQGIALCREWGFDIPSFEGRAVLPRNEDSLVPAWVEEESRAAGWGELTVAGFLDLGSTNDEALARAQTPGTLLVHAELQSAGKGRKGRRWNSPPREGLYFSLMFRPSQPQNRWPLLTHVASVALVQALKQITDRFSRPLDLDLKWPNDVLLSGKKTAGILLETASAGPGDFAAVVGVGVNIAAGCVPDDLRETATSIADETGVAVPRRALLIRYVESFRELYALFELGDHAEILERWKRLSTMWEGVPVKIVEGNTTRLAVTCGLDELGALRIRMAEGVEETVMAGDVTVRRVAGR